MHKDQSVANNVSRIGDQEKTIMRLSIDNAIVFLDQSVRSGSSRRNVSRFHTQGLLQGFCYDIAEGPPVQVTRGSSCSQKKRKMMACTLAQFPPPKSKSQAQTLFVQKSTANNTSHLGSLRGLTVFRSNPTAHPHSLAWASGVLQPA